jgi:tryptophan synthase alpha chain
VEKGARLIMPLNFEHKPSLVTYFTIGDPSLKVSRDIILAAIDNGADIVELGVPFSDPLADGPVIQRASERALHQHVSLQDVIKLGAEVRLARPQAGLIIFSYLNPILRFGLKHFCAALESTGIDGALVTDLTVEEAGEYIELMREHGRATVFLAAPTSPDARLKAIAKASTGFVYAVSRLGVTGMQKQISGDAPDVVRRLRKFTGPRKLPIAVGFGISNPQQFAEAGKYCDGVVVGSALVETIERSRGREAQAVAEFVRRLKPAGA